MYTGIYNWTLDEEEMAEWYSNRLPAPTDLKTNQYLFIENLEGNIVDKYRCDEDGLKKVLFNTISNKFSNTVIKPRNDEQIAVIDSLNNRSSKVKVIRGVYGSGKDYLMLNKALELIESEIFNKIVFIRPNVTVKDVPDIGYLKGDEYAKLGWTLAPLYDKVGGEEGVQYLIDNGKLEMAPLLFLRGRSFDNSIVYVCEGQNITSEIAKLIISRIGDNSELWINCDTHQVDKRVYEQDNGINLMIDRLAGHRLFSYVYMPKTERGEVAELCTLLDN